MHFKNFFISRMFMIDHLIIILLKLQLFQDLSQNIKIMSDY